MAITATDMMDVQNLVAAAIHNEEELSSALNNSMYLQSKFYTLENKNQAREQELKTLQDEMIQKDLCYANMQEQIEWLHSRMSRKITMVHNCGNCGAKLEVPENNGVFHCRYCGTSYVIGATQLYSTY